MMYLGWKGSAGCVHQGQSVMRNAYCFECFELQEGRDKWASLFSGPDTAQELMWQEDLSSVAKFINDYPDKVDF